MKYLALIHERSDEQTSAAAAWHSRRRKPVGVGEFLACQAAFELRFGTHRPRGFEVNCTHRRHARGQLLFCSRMTPRYRSFQRFEATLHRARLTPPLATISRQHEAATQQPIDMILPIPAQGFALKFEHFSEQIRHRSPRVSYCIESEIGPHSRSRKLCRACPPRERRHSEYVQRKQGKIKGAAPRARKALSAHGFSHLISRFSTVLIEIAH